MFASKRDRNFYLAWFGIIMFLITVVSHTWFYGFPGSTNSGIVFGDCHIGTVGYQFSGEPHTVGFYGVWENDC